MAEVTIPEEDSDDDAMKMAESVRAALSPVLGAKPYVVVVDDTTFEQLAEETTSVVVIQPKYQRDVIGHGLIDYALGII